MQRWLAQNISKMKDFFALQLNHSQSKVLFLDIYQEQNYIPDQICKEKRGVIYFLIGKTFGGYVFFNFTLENSVEGDSSDFENVSRSFWFNSLGSLNICQGSFLCKSLHDLLP